MTGALVPHSTMEARCLLLLAFTEWWGVALDARIIIGLPAIVNSTPLPFCLLTIIGSYCGEGRLLLRPGDHACGEDKWACACPRHYLAGQMAGPHRRGDSMSCGCCAGTCEICGAMQSRELHELRMLRWSSEDLKKGGQTQDQAGAAEAAGVRRSEKGAPPS